MSKEFLGVGLTWTLPYVVGWANMDSPVCGRWGLTESIPYAVGGG
jgi:hypothetical protein